MCPSSFLHTSRPRQEYSRHPAPAGGAVTTLQSTNQIARPRLHPSGCGPGAFFFFVNVGYITAILDFFLLSVTRHIESLIYTLSSSLMCFRKERASFSPDRFRRKSQATQSKWPHHTAAAEMVKEKTVTSLLQVLHKDVLWIFTSHIIGCRLTSLIQTLRSVLHKTRDFHTLSRLVITSVLCVTLLIRGGQSSRVFDSLLDYLKMFFL